MKHGQEEKKLKILIYPALLLALITVAAMAISIGGSTIYTPGDRCRFLGAVRPALRGEY